MKKIALFFLAAIVLTLTFGCNAKPVTVSNQNIAPLNQNLNSQPIVTPEPPKTEVINYLVSEDEYTKYCNGGDMDSAGYQKSLTKKMTKTVEGTNLTLLEKTYLAVNAASEQANLNNIVEADNNYLKISGQTVYIKPVDGWAGVSIFLCAWQPLVETNLLQFPEIKKIEWLNDPQKWQDIN